jgi:hypothetical protein
MLQRLWHQWLLEVRPSGAAAVLGYGKRDHVGSAAAVAGVWIRYLVEREGRRGGGAPGECGSECGTSGGGR